MDIRFAREEDIPDITSLLKQVALIHHQGRPDLFKAGVKYTPDKLLDIIKDKNRPILVADDGKKVVGYAFCIIQKHSGDSVLTDISTLYLDDLCVDENMRGKHIGSAIYAAVLTLAKELGCHNVTLNVWAMNDSAQKFYNAQGLKPLKTCMEQIID